MALPNRLLKNYLLEPGCNQHPDSIFFEKNKTLQQAISLAKPYWPPILTSHSYKISICQMIAYIPIKNIP